jgi:hypothetical protein
MKHIQAWLLFFVLFLFRLTFVITGLFIVPIAYVFKDGAQFRKLFWLWSNAEDGIFGPVWFNKGVKNLKTCYLWSAIRNPANNMRYTRLFSVHHSHMKKSIVYGDERTPDPIISRHRGRAVWHYTLIKANGLYYPSFWILGAKGLYNHYRFRIGFKCTPEWITKPRAKAYEYSGMTIQFMPNREG